MTAYRVMRVRCDTCGAHAPDSLGNASARAARLDAAMVGWTYCEGDAAHEGGADSCPACSQRVRRLTVVTKARKDSFSMRSGVGPVSVIKPKDGCSAEELAADAAFAAVIRRGPRVEGSWEPPAPVGLVEETLTRVVPPAHRHWFAIHRHPDWFCHPRAGHWHAHVWWRHTHEDTECARCRSWFDK